MVRPAIRCSRCIPKTYKKQRAAATIGAMLRRQVASTSDSSILLQINVLCSKLQSLGRGSQTL
ncbi:MAG: hypothetical protein WCL14_09845 [Bacteroidota bacterium]